ncbi:TSUP family transporter [Paenibacillus sp. SYP-B3998]|uniref:Probable membrane transporter protein n=1 Tax=Paenibacillus sp. SYP-B3998 TaxID=2678564 RepID=A0A6G4A4B3_9BACL|nr:TSUP family transporter [Paenibacillus sp. SYP-B3998]NEW09222.1 TSUP family transporter [Paenibacillus sp. SYP-B3998]
MEYPSLEMLFFLIGAGFLAAFIDAVVGGGGLISLPALLFAGLPPVFGLGTNKLGGTMSSLTSTSSFLLSKKVNMRLAAWLFPLSFIGAILGTYTVKQVPSDFLKPLVVCMLVVVTIYTLMKKNWGATSTFSGLTAKTITLLICGAFAIGFYDGFFGPGAGSFLIFLFLMVGFDFVGASANAKVLNLASNAASLGTFFLMKSVNWYYGLPMGIAMIAGALIGSQVAIRKGSTFVKPLFILVTVLLIGKQVWTLIFHA